MPPPPACKAKGVLTEPALHLCDSLVTVLPDWIWLNSNLHILLPLRPEGWDDRHVPHSRQEFSRSANWYHQLLLTFYEELQIKHRLEGNGSQMA